MGARGIKHPDGGYTMRCMACGKYEGWAVCEYMPNYCDHCNQHLNEIPPIDELPYFAERLKNRT